LRIPWYPLHQKEGEKKMSIITPSQFKALRKMTGLWILQQHPNFHCQRNSCTGDPAWKIVEKLDNGRIRVECKGEIKYVESSEIVNGELVIKYLDTEKRECFVAFYISSRGRIHSTPDLLL
jgi:hypothetical protein